MKLAYVIDIFCIVSHPPCGGCGLKFDYPLALDINFSMSPSVWRVWIEIQQVRCILHKVFVTLRVEGVD